MFCDLRDEKIVGSVSFLWCSCSNMEKQSFDHCFMLYFWMQKIALILFIIDIIREVFNPRSILFRNITETTWIHNWGKCNSFSIIIIIVSIKHLNILGTFTILHLWKKEWNFISLFGNDSSYSFSMSLFLGHGDISFWNIFQNDINTCDYFLVFFLWNKIFHKLRNSIKLV